MLLLKTSQIDCKWDEKVKMTACVGWTSGEKSSNDYMNAGSMCQYVFTKRLRPVASSTSYESQFLLVGLYIISRFVHSFPLPVCPSNSTKKNREEIARLTAFLHHPLYSWFTIQRIFRNEHEFVLHIRFVFWKEVPTYSYCQTAHVAYNLMPTLSVSLSLAHTTIDCDTKKR